MAHFANLPADPRFEPPPPFVFVDRRMAGVARDLWLRSGGGRVEGFADHSLIVADPAGAATITSVGVAIKSTFGLGVGMALDGLSGLGAEVRAACDLIAFDPKPVPFETSLGAHGRACLLVRGIALPLGPADDPTLLPSEIQVIVNWRELLDRAATTRLRREIGAALRLTRPNSVAIDPFSPKSLSKSPE